MKDIPMFTTEFGVASLILKEIPYRETAYVKIRTVFHGKLRELIDECVGFCRAAGAERVYAAGDEGLDQYPHFCSVFTMKGSADFEPEANLWPVTEETVTQWRKIYNEKMAEVDNAGTMTAYDEKELVSSAGTYFVHENGKLLGIGWVEPGELKCVAAVVPGTGERVLKTLLSAQNADRVELDVASTNQKAIRLYEKLGFVTVREKSRWYQVR